ncbi:MAG: tripartite tricarboxylate transporter TctB family protein [Rhodospirillales bacterium]|nr:tripartite tricarboxylate transporter TctB family protein [Rhodospirillales bacterium]
MHRINADVVIALLLLILCGGLYLDTHFYQTVPGAIIGAKIWPRVVTFFLGGLSAIYLFQSLQKGRPEKSADDAAPLTFREWLDVNRNVVGCFALYAFFLMSLKWLGMLLGGMAFVFMTLTFLGPNNRRSHLMNALVAIGAIGCMWAIFTFGLGVILPQGEILPR